VSSVPSQVAPRASQYSPRFETIQKGGYRCVSVEEGYRRWAATYDRDLNPLLALEERRLGSMLPPLAGKRVLDLACGTGRWLAWILSQGATFALGVDFSKAMLAGARVKAGLENRLVRADCRNTPFPAAAFDLVVCSFLLGHLAEFASVAREVARVTAPGGSVYIGDLHPEAYARGWRTGFRDSCGAAEIMTWPHSVRELLVAWNSAGFKSLEIADCRLGEAERPIFNRAGKVHLFAEACQAPAVLILQFQRKAPHVGTNLG